MPSCVYHTHVYTHVHMHYKHHTNYTLTSQHTDSYIHIHAHTQVETIGEAYIATTNLLVPQPGDHAVRLAEFALEVMCVCE